MFTTTTWRIGYVTSRYSELTYVELVTVDGYDVNFHHLLARAGHNEVHSIHSTGAAITYGDRSQSHKGTVLDYRPAYEAAVSEPVLPVGTRVSWQVTTLHADETTSQRSAYGTVVGHDEPHLTAPAPRRTTLVIPEAAAPGSYESRNPFSFGYAQLTLAPRVSLAKAAASFRRAPKASALVSRAPRINLDKEVTSAQVLVFGKWVTVPITHPSVLDFPIENVRALPFGAQPYIRRSTLHS